MRRRSLCEWGIHDFEDFPDPNPESGGLEKQGYRACTRCSKEKDSAFYRPPFGIGTNSGR